MSLVEHFRHEDTPSAEVERREALYGPLGDSVRALVDATIRTELDEVAVRAATAEVEAVVARLRASQIDGAYGLRYNAEGRSWGWGNAVVGIRNGLAPPLATHRAESGAMYAELALGAAYEGAPGLLHTGVGAMLLDHIMGETASGAVRVTFTGTLTMRCLRGTPLGPIRLDARVDRIEGPKVYVLATLSDPDGVAMESDGVFIVPRWARPED
ncbi:MAG: thioesterase [Nocardioides sp.]|nr:thioesterase [Nocardioides sp.]